ncbi:hypothetical protein MWN33_17900 [Starkeya koreensis]|uniref:Uncharacterized protein n=1 Tax=Ancylobacter koreensis TaxID=266121 RepID=A0ABT0DRK1_9HYPH|nr:hypothetical protein [Ancylobacter koreensis]MCK0209908.1 hypothetical protein [Ancylobacter koreensis]
MAARVSLNQMQAEVGRLSRLPFTAAELAAIRQATPAVAPKLSAKFEPENGFCYMVASQLHMEFVVVKSARLRLPFGLSLPRYTIYMGFEHGEIWEKGPRVNRLRAVTYVFQRLVATDSWLDTEYGRKH